MSTVKLADCCKFFSGGTPTKGKTYYWNGEIPWFSPKDIKSFELVSSQDRISEIAVRESATRLINPGTILVVSRSGVLAHTLPVGIVRQPSTFNQDIKAIVPSDDYDPEYVALYLTARQSFVLKEGVKRGPTVHSLIADFIEELEIPDIPIDEQRQIAARLKAQLAEVETARQAAQVQLSDTRLLRSRIIAETFDDIDAHPTVLGSVIRDIQAGKSFQTSEILAQPNELGVLKVSAVSWSSFRSGQAKALNGSYGPEKHHRVSEGDFIISRANTKELVGAVVLVDRDYPTRLLSDKTLRLVIDEEQASKEYLLYALRAPIARKHIEHFATGTSDSMRNISQGVITSIPIVLPDLQAQIHIATKLKAQLDEINSLETANKTALADLSQLPQHLLIQAFQR